MTQRETLLTETFVSLADTIVTGFEVVDFLSLLSSRCVELFDAAEAGLMLLDGQGHMQVAASSSYEMRLLELFEVQHEEGPCPDAYRTGKAVRCPDLSDAIDTWPTFAPEALAAGFRSAHALPMRLRDEVIGALNFIHEQPGGLAEDDMGAAQALADVATIGLLHHRAAEEARLLTDELQLTLTSRMIVEQARGVIGHSTGLDMDQSYNLLREFSKRRNERLVITAHAIVSRTLDPTSLGQARAGRARLDGGDVDERDPGR